MLSCRNLWAASILVLITLASRGNIEMRNEQIMKVSDDNCCIRCDFHLPLARCPNQQPAGGKLIHYLSWLEEGFLFVGLHAQHSQKTHETTTVLFV